MDIAFPRTFCFSNMLMVSYSNSECDIDRFWFSCFFSCSGLKFVRPGDEHTHTYTHPHIHTRMQSQIATPSRDKASRWPDES